MASAGFIQGDEVKNFEKNFSDYLEVKYCISVNSGTDALILGLRSLNLKPQDEVIIPANTFIATALGATENNLKPVFVDIDPQDFGIDLTDLKNKINQRTKAVVVVHLFGQPDKISEIKDIIKQSKQKIYLIEDACQAHGAYYYDKRVGGEGIFSAFSFYPGKNLGAYGDGGAIVTNDKRIAEKIKLLREYGQSKKYFHETLGINSRLDTIQAAILNIKLTRLDHWNKQRQAAALYYTNQIKTFFPNLLPPQKFFDRQSVYHLYVVRTKKRNQLLKFLNKNNVQALIHYPVPLHLQKAFHYLGYKKGDLPNTEKAASEILSLPIYPEITKKQIDYIIGKLKDFYKIC